jgi:adenine/guanine phosphoribosyltransferase-like PRPP-binding protein
VTFDAATRAMLAPLQLTLAGPERRGLVVGARVAVQLDLELVHVMPVRTGGD